MPLEQETVVPEHVLPEPIPTTVMGLQVRPSKTSRSERDTPILFKRVVPATESAYRLVREHPILIDCSRVDIPGSCLNSRPWSVRRWGWRPQGRAEPER